MKYLTLKSLNAYQFPTDTIFKWELSKWKDEDEKLREFVYTKIDMLLLAFEKPALISQLNDMQVEVNIVQKDGKVGCFESKFTIPLYFVNLILKQYNLELKYED